MFKTKNMESFQGNKQVLSGLDLRRQLMWELTNIRSKFNENEPTLLQRGDGPQKTEGIPMA